MTEQEMTVAVQAAAKVVWDQRRQTLPPGAPEWESLDPINRVDIMEAVMPVALAAAEAVVPIASRRAWQEGYDDSFTVDGVTKGNPYPVVL